jgi:hypothetical protein
MKKRSFVLVAALLTVVGPAVLADNPNDNGSSVPPGQQLQALKDQIDAVRGNVGENLINRHYEKLFLTIDPTDRTSVSIPLPRANRPVRITVSLSFRNGSLISPSELMYAVVNLDPTVTDSSGAPDPQMTWIGTDSDGHTLGSNTRVADPPVIATIICSDTDCSSPLADLEADVTAVPKTAPYGSLVLTQFADSVGYYTVEVWY